MLSNCYFGCNALELCLSDCLSACTSGHRALLSYARNGMSFASHKSLLLVQLLRSRSCKLHCDYFNELLTCKQLPLEQSPLPLHIAVTLRSPPQHNSGSFGHTKNPTSMTTCSCSRHIVLDPQSKSHSRSLGQCFPEHILQICER